MSLLGFLRSLGTSTDFCELQDVTIRGTRMEFKRCELPSGITYRLYTDDNEYPNGEMVIKHDRDQSSTVDYISVDDKNQKKGVGTFLYEAAAKDACQLGYALKSSDYRSEFSEAFWQKQALKGRASCIAGRGGLFITPLEEAQRLALDPVQFEEMVARLPKPQSSKYDKHWGCHHYRIENPCETPSLAGLKPRRKRRK